MACLDGMSTLGWVENHKSLIFLKSQAGFHGAHKNKVIHYVLKTQNIRFHIGKCHFMGLILRNLDIRPNNDGPIDIF